MSLNSILCLELSSKILRRSFTYCSATFKNAILKEDKILHKSRSVAQAGIDTTDSFELVIVKPN